MSTAHTARNWKTTSYESAATAAAPRLLSFSVPGGGAYLYPAPAPAATTHFYLMHPPQAWYAAHAPPVAAAASAPAATTPPAAAIIVASAAPSQPQQPSSVFVTVTLQRSRLDESWGLSVSKFDDSVILGDACPRKVPKRLVHAMDPSSNRPVPPALFPGDAIFKINGRCVSTFLSLKDVTNELRRLYTLELLLFRYGPALAQARAAMHAVQQQQPPLDYHECSSPAYRAAVAAYQVLKQYQEENGCNSNRLIIPTACSGPAAPTATVSGSTLLFTPSRNENAGTLSLPPARVTPAPGTPKLAAVVSPQQQQQESPLPTLPQKSGSKKNAFIAAAAGSGTQQSSSSFCKKHKESRNEQQQFFSQQPQCLYATTFQFHHHLPMYYYTNPIFRDEHGFPVPYDDDNWEYDDPDEGTRANLFLRTTTMDRPTFLSWLQQRKTEWRKRYRVNHTKQLPNILVQNEHFYLGEYGTTAHSAYRSSSVDTASLVVNLANPLFKDAHGKPLEYVDNWEFDPDDGNRAQLFLPPIADPSIWLKQRKARWREECYRVTADTPVPNLIQDEHYYHREVPSFLNSMQDNTEQDDRRDSIVAINFWADRYDTFDSWLKASTLQWKQSYSWNRRKRKRLQRDCRQAVSLDTDPYAKWLRVRKNQWKVERRKRQRLRQHVRDDLEKRPVADPEEGEQLEDEQSAQQKTTNPADSSPKECHATGISFDTLMKRSGFAATAATAANDELVLIDALLEEQEREQRLHEARRQTLDISFLFDASLGCPDDVSALIIRFLDPLEHGKLLCISKKLRNGLIERESVWRQLCPEHWILPRRPRKPWHVIYLAHMRFDMDQSRKRCDDLLSKISATLFKGDHLQTIEKMVTEAERDYGFDVNYSSGVVCERNAILNLAVIHGRHKVVRWLVEAKGADIETRDRGSFTPLINAAWAGDKYLVRFFLQKGADRSVLGKCHYTKPLAPPDFKGVTAEGWAERKGFNEIATLIRLGL